VTIRVRPFAERDYPALARISQIGTGKRLEANEIRAADARWDRRRYEKVRIIAADEEDAPIGYGEIHHEPSRFDPRRYFVRLGVEPTLRRRGIGAAIWDHLRAELDERAAAVACLWVGDATACQSFIAARGFAEVIRAYERVLAVASAPLPSRAAEERVTRTGIRITSLARLRDAIGDDALRMAYELHSACRLDQPTLGRVTPQPFADWLAFNVDAPEAIAEAYLIALDGADAVGCCSVRRQTDDTLRIGITGVLPAHRRRGIGRLLKLRIHAWAKAHGFSEIHTSNTAPNKPIVALNDALGYAIVGSWGGYELRLAAERRRDHVAPRVSR
jgi:GNAT superfamily N-acetyltransferase